MRVYNQQRLNLFETRGRILIGSNIVGSTWNYIQCFEILAGAQLEPVFGGSATQFKSCLNSLNWASDFYKTLVKANLSMLQKYVKLAFYKILNCLKN